MSADGPIVAEVRERRHQISNQHEHDLDKYFKHLCEVQERYRDRLVDQITVVRSTPPPKT